MTAADLQALVDEWAAALAEVERTPSWDNFARYRAAAAALKAAATPEEAE